MLSLMDMLRHQSASTFSLPGDTPAIMDMGQGLGQGIGAHQDCLLTSGLAEPIGIGPGISASGSVARL